MRWTDDPGEEDERIINIFLLWPRELLNKNTGKKEWRWLERASIWQFKSIVLRQWVDLYWVDNEKQRTQNE